MSLLSSNAAKGQPKSQKCKIRVLDTVFFSGESPTPEWYFTSKSGGILRKNEDKCSTAGVVKRFSDFALANHNNIHNYVGVMYHRNGQRNFFTAEELSNSLASGQHRNASDAGSFMQVYLQPSEGLDTIYVLETTRSKSGGSSSGEGASEGYVHTMGRKTFTSANAIPTMEHNVPDAIQEQMKTYVEAVTEYCSQQRGSQVLSMTAEFIVDDNQHVWLSHISRCTTTSTPINTSVMVATAQVPSEEQKDDVLPVSTSILPSLRSMAGGGGASSAVEHGVDDALWGNEPKKPLPKKLENKVDSLLHLEGAVYRSSAAADELPGLRAWVMASTSVQTNKGEKSVWSIDLNHYHNYPSSSSVLSQSGMSSPTSSRMKQELKNKRSQERQVVSSDLVDLLTQAESLLRGQLPITNEDDFQQAWRNCHRLTLMAMKEKIDPYGPTEQVVVGHPSPLLPLPLSLPYLSFTADSTTHPCDLTTLFFRLILQVCGNTHVICKKIESIRDVNFQYSISPTPLLIPKANSSQSLLFDFPATSPSLRSMDLAGVQVFSPMRMVSGYGATSPGDHTPSQSTVENLLKR